MTLAYKSWLEIRPRLFVLVGGWLFVLLTFVATARHDPARDHAMRAFHAISSVEAIMLIVFGAMLAGSGVVSQGCARGTPRMPESVLFTLSLPVSRRRLLLSRAAVGALVLAPMVVLFWLVLPVVARAVPGMPSRHALMAALPVQFVSATLGYTLALAGTAVFSEMIFAWILGSAGALAGIGAGLDAPVLSGFLDFASGTTYVSSGHVPWTGIAVCLALSCLSVFIAVRAIERRDF